MKLTKLFGPALAALALLATGCSNENTGTQQEAGEAVMYISLKGTSSETRATGTPTEESTIHHFTVYVFNAENDVLEEIQPVTDGSTSTIISGLSTGFDKKVVVIANAPSTFPTLVQGDLYSKLMQTSAAINLNYQSPANVATNGLVMVGETEQPVEMQLTGTTPVTITVKRLVSKVQLGTITITPIGDNDIELLDVTGVSIQRAYAATDIWGNVLDRDNMYGGVIGSWNNPTQTYLYDAFNPIPTFTVGQGMNFDNYFYVLPNQDNDYATLLTVHSTYNGDPQYYPIKINGTIGDANTDGTLITSNHIYTINLKVNNLGEGTDDPDEVPEFAPIEVTVEVAEWDNEIIQNVIW